MGPLGGIDPSVWYERMLFNRNKGTRIVHITASLKPVVEHWLEQEISQCVECVAK